MDAYTLLQSGSDQVSLKVKKDGSSTVTDLTGVGINEVPAFDQTNYYFLTGGLGTCVLASNATIGGTHPYYRYDSSTSAMVEAGTVEIVSSTPADYFNNVKTGNFELEQRS